MSASTSIHLVTDSTIVAHLFYATIEIEIVTVQIGRSTISGTMLEPDADSRTFGFRPDPNEEVPERLLRPGKILRLRYASLMDEYDFQGSLSGVEEDVWRIGIPRTIDRKDRRLLHRYPVLKTKRFMVQLQGSGVSSRRLLVVDLSPAGFAALVDPRLDKFEQGETRRAVLYLPGHPALNARCVVVNFRHLEEDRAQGIVGCCFAGLGYSSCRLLAELLADWR